MLGRMMLSTNPTELPIFLCCFGSVGEFGETVRRGPTCRAPHFRYAAQRSVTRSIIRCDWIGRDDARADKEIIEVPAFEASTWLVTSTIDAEHIKTCVCSAGRQGLGSHPSSAYPLPAYWQPCFVRQERCDKRFARSHAHLIHLSPFPMSSVLHSPHPPRHHSWRSSRPSSPTVCPTRTTWKWPASLSRR